jgi:ribosome-associated protein
VRSFIKPKNNALAIAGAASDKKALDIVLVNMRKVPSVCDWFVVSSGTSTTHVRAISDSIIRKLKEKGQRPWHVEGEPDASWVLIDYGDVVAHVFLEETRRFYNLEKLWREAPQEHYKERARGKKVKVKARAKVKAKAKPKSRSKIKVVRKPRKKKR